MSRDGRQERYRELLLSLLLAGAGCATPASYVPAGVPSAVIGAAQPKALIGGGTYEERATLAKAVAAAEQIYASAAFSHLLTGHKWLRAPSEEERLPSMPAIVEGEDVAVLLGAARPIGATYRIVVNLYPWEFWRYAFPGRTDADTAVCGDISLRRGVVVDGSYLVKTVAHENVHRLDQSTHLSSCAIGNARYEFSDGNYDTNSVAWLVSYAVGDLAECLYQEAGNEDRARACFERSGDKAGRHYAECCDRDGPASPLVETIRRDSKRCEDVVSLDTDARRRRCEMLTGLTPVSPP